ncbi:MAG TPA: glycoside hydrolase family 2 TIM barrel-domain containing protein [Bryobacteraceae bacterium]|jgi:beta-galactosidase
MESSALSFGVVLFGDASGQVPATLGRGPATRILNLNRGWFFGAEPDDKGLAQVTLPHCVAKLSWQNWNPVDWEKQWFYRRQFAIPREFRGHRIFLHFEHVMIAATPVINGRKLPQHVGGFLPFEYEITGLTNDRENVLAVAVDSRWMNVPPEGSPKGPSSIDYLLPGGITGSVSLRAVPQIFIADVFAKPVNVLDSKRRLEIVCSIDCATVPEGEIHLEAALRDGTRVIAHSATSFRPQKTGESEARFSITGLEGVALWDVVFPKLYDLTVTLFANGRPVHEYRTPTGFREARFDVDGFFLNGHRLQLFGLNRHELYPYVGRAMPPRVLRKDAEILKNEFHCNAVRCSHYPQSEAFLDACDELGLLVWEEVPGWQYLGDASWQDLAVRDVQDMLRRDRNHPSIVIWGVRINESPNNPALYHRTKEAAKLLDDSRPTSGSMTRRSTDNWFQDVFAFDDYHSAPDGSVGLVPPLPGIPFFFSEAVGQFSYGGRGFNNKYRRAGDVAMQQKQALYHARVHDRAAFDPRYAGVIAWCAFEYGSLLNDYAGVKYPGVADVFRVPKLGASFYRSQVDPKQWPVIEPNFYWNFGPTTPSGPGKDVLIFSNLEKLELRIDGKLHSALHPDRAGFPHLNYPPFLADLVVDGSRKPELRIDGYSGGTLVLSRSFSADPASDRLLLQADDSEIRNDGSDATRLVFRVVDKFGAPRLFAGGSVTFAVQGPGVIVGDNPFDLAASGGVGAVWIKAKPGSRGPIRISAQHSSLGSRSVEIRVGV